ncbi:MAG: DNA polymerase III subunit delta [Clostridia bacterium]|nr:DNA polymerase III subunit delta [Clostridia bacterium]
MAKLTETEFRKKLSSGEPDRVYLIYGEEKFLVKNYTARLCEKIAGKSPSEFDFVKLGSAAELEEIFSACEQFPMFSKYKCVVVSDMNIDALPESDLKLLMQYCEDVSPSTVLIFTMPTLSQDPKKTGDKKTTKLSKLAAAVQKFGTVTEFAKKDNTSLEKVLISWAEKNGCGLSPRSASRIIALSGTDMTTLRNEIDKLSAYANGGEITEDVIRSLSIHNTEVRIFALSDCLASGDYSGAYKQLHGLFEQNEKSEIILSTLSSVYLDMYRAKVASESGVSISQAASDFKYGRREFLLKNAAQRASRYKTSVLRRILDIILEADMTLKSKPTNKQILLETLIARLISETDKMNNT